MGSEGKVVGGDEDFWSGLSPSELEELINTSENYFNGAQRNKRRRSTRVIKPPEVFKVVHEKRLDKELRAAIKRSKLETHQLQLEYADLEEMPTVFPTLEEFKDPVHFWNKYSELGNKYGAVKIVPPKEWSTICPLDIERLKFKVREQELRNLCNGKGFSHPTYEWDCKRMKESDEEFVKNLFCKLNPSVEEVERKYWDLVKAGETPLVVKYGADLNVYSPEFKEYLVQDAEGKYRDGAWNLKNTPKSPGSLLRYLDNVIPGVNSPWLYIGMCLTSFCWHTEDNYFGAINYHHWGEPKIWYVVPPQYANKIESLLKNYLASESEEFAVYSLRLQVPPDVLVANGVSVYRAVQRENEFIFAWPRAYHSGLNVGFNCNEACNLAPVSWLPMGFQSVSSYKYNRKTCLSVFSLVMKGLCNYKEFSTADLSDMIRFFSLMISQEFDLRKDAKYPTVQMYLHYENGGNFDIQSLFKDAPASGFDAATFMRAVTLLHSKEEQEFMEGCRLLSSAPMKDCDLCDTPTFGCCVVCIHCNCTVCMTCLSYHPCVCDSRIVLYRYPLQALSRLMTILKRHYHKLNGAPWKVKVDWNVPRNVELFNVDSSSVFQAETVGNNIKSSTPTKTKRIGKESLACDKKKLSNSVGHGLESLSTQADSLCDDSPICSIIDESNDWNPGWFKDFESALSRFNVLTTEEKGPENESMYGEISFCDPCSISPDKSTNAVDCKSLATVTKFTARYILLALEEDSKESI